MTLDEFVSRYQAATGTERALSQSHFNDLCAVLGKPTPASDPTGDRYAFEKSVLKTGGGQGFADVWLKGHFAWEYKGKKKNLSAAYDQLRQYEEALQNPPLLVVCDLDRFEVHTRFNGVVKQVYGFNLDDLRANIATPTCPVPPLDVLRALFDNPDRLRPQTTTAQVTEEVAKEFSRIAAQLQERKVEPHKAARFLIRLLFCLFAEDVGLLPRDLFTGLVEATRNTPDRFAVRIKNLFAAMAEGGTYGNDDIKYFNGGLFEDSEIIPLTSYELGLLSFAAKRDWSNVEPSIFGTLFERGLNPAKRAQLGAHYTSRDDILAIVEPVLMAPLRKRWADVQESVLPLVEKRDAISQKATPGVPLTGKDRRDIDTINTQISQALRAFGEELGAVRVLDPACGSGNFLYVALRALLDLNKAVLAFSTAVGLPSLDLHVQPLQMRGIELNEYAHELAPVTLQIGYIQWLRESGLGQPSEPILQNLQDIVERDAVLGVADDGTPLEPSWPEADVIIGNPPFLGGNKVRQELGSEYVDRLFRLYEGRVPAFADLVCYWFERVRALVERGDVKRAGLIATDSIRGGANRRVLERIKQTGDVFMAWDSRPWVLDGAAVRISIVGFDNGTEMERTLNNAPVTNINADLTGAVDLTTVQVLKENAGIAFRGNQKGGAFDVTGATVAQMLVGVNQSGKPNSDVLRPWVNGLDLTGRNRGMWLVDFGISASEEEAKAYEAPFEHIERCVKPNRLNHSKWWIHERTRPELRGLLVQLNRFAVTPHVSKYRFFTWLENPTVPDHQLIAVARADDYFFGVLHSRAHELWALRLGTALEDRPRYTPSTTFETFPFPWAPGTEPNEADSPQVRAVADAARALVAARDAWLNPPDATPAELQKRTLTNLYNACPDCLANAHMALDATVLAAYVHTTGEPWPADMSDDELLARLLALNLQRAQHQAANP